MNKIQVDGGKPMVFAIGTNNTPWDTLATYDKDQGKYLKCAHLVNPCAFIKNEDTGKEYEACHWHIAGDWLIDGVPSVSEWRKVDVVKRDLGGWLLVLGDGAEKKPEYLEHLLFTAPFVTVEESIIQRAS